MSAFDKAITGITIIGLITAIGLHSASLTSVTKAGGSAVSGLMNTVQRG